MEQHGSESYFVIGEGLLSEAAGGRDSARSSAAKAAPPFRFSRMGPHGTGHQLGEPLRKKLGALMASGGGGTSGIPAGFTYLGQFIDHDLTFDKTNVMLGASVNATQLLQARSPSLDLDSLYGAGPSDPARTRRVFLGYSYLAPVFKPQPLRNNARPDQSYTHVGFRVACDLP